MKRKNVKGLAYILVLSLIFSIFLTACAKAPTGGDTAEGGDGIEKEKVLVIGYDRDPEILDHIKTGWYSDALIYMFDRLVSRDYNFNYKPGLAESWETSEDGLVWTFHLREGVKFHDGKPLTAHDVKWTFDTILDPDTASPFAGDLAAIKEINVVDELTVEFVLHYTFPNLLFNLSNTASGIANPEAYERHGDEYGHKYVVGTGPYIFKDWIKGDRIVIVKNPDYNWGPEWMANRGPALIDKIILRTIPEENTRLMELETGGIHMLRNVPPTFVDQIERSDEVELVRGDATRLGYLAYATDKDPFTDIRVRRAINHAINREDIITYVFRGLAQEAYGYLPPALQDEYYEGSERDGYKYDLERAKELLVEAGFPEGFHVTLSADNSTESSRLAEVLQNQLKQVGIDANIRLYDSSSYTAMLREGEQELFLRLYSWPNADILDWFLLSSQFPFPNHSRWVDEKTDELLNGAAQAATWEERGEGYKEAQKYLIEQAVWAPIYVPDNLIAVRKEILNFKYHPWQIQFNDGIDMMVD